MMRQAATPPMPKHDAATAREHTLRLSRVGNFSLALELDWLPFRKYLAQCIVQALSVDGAVSWVLTVVGG